ncbi:MAG: YsnF/AvaK domain-containing protein, partial [Acidobacteriaceae bacterium]|nr:YsnF/AvaK domain-containing protein [Acidobacteriaceae bacterium]
MAQATTNNATVVGVFRDESTAKSVMNELENLGIPRSRMHLGSRSDWTADAARGGAGLSGQTPQHKTGFIGWLESLFGSSDDNSHYAEAVRRGNCVLAVDAADTDRDHIVDVMEQYDAVDVDREVENYRQAGYESFDPASRPYTDTEVADERRRFGNAPATGVGSNAQSIPVVQEELQVGKRTVQRGGVRVFTRTTEQPVEDQVTLREEKVRVDRRPVNEPVSARDANLLKDQTIEVMETAEEPVVSKVARVVEQVVVGKEATERTETVRDTVRRQEVQVEQIGPNDTQTTTRSGLSGYGSDYS